MNTDNDDNTLTLTASAQKNLEKMILHSQRITDWYGSESSVAIKATNSLNSVLFGMIRLGGKIYGVSDGLIGVVDEYGYTYGIVFHSSPLPEEFKHCENLPHPVVGTWSINS